MENTITRKKIIREAVLFAAFFTVVIISLLRGQNLKQVIATIRSAKLSYVILGLCLASAFHFLEGTNIWLMLRSFGCKVNYQMGFKYALTGFFFSSISPGSVAGQPMQLYAMKSDNISIYYGSFAILMELTSSQIATFLFEILAVLALPFASVEMKPHMKALCVLGFAMNLIFISFLLILLFSVKMGTSLLRISCFIIDKLPRMHDIKKEYWKNKLIAGLEKFHNCAIMVRQKKRTVFKVTMISIIQIICWFSVPYVVYRALGESGASYPKLFLLQILIYMMTALLPLPGGIGINEFVFIELFSSIYSADLITAATLISRGISFYYLLFTSGILILIIKIYQIHKRKGRSD